MFSDVTDRNENAFTLIELAIVLVIVGIVAGGVVTGQSLIRAAELNSVVKEYQQYQTAVTIFDEKYGALPGDFSQATQLWGARDVPLDENWALSDDSACGVTDTANDETDTCKGNGDGRVDETNNTKEYLTFWQHLFNAKILHVPYTGYKGVGVPIANRQKHVAGENAPSSRSGENAVWGARTHDPDPTEQYAWLPNSNGFTFMYGGVDEGTPHERILTPMEAYRIDKKIDDGRPAWGIIQPFRPDGDCTTGDETTYDADYFVTHEEVACSLIFFYNGAPRAKRP